VKITFDPERHAYTVDGAAVPSVSRICDIVDPPSSFYRPEHATRGKYVHSACEYADAGVLREDLLDPALTEYVNAWKNFRRDTGAEVLSSETVVASKYGYAGRLDRLLKIPTSGIGVVDIKSGDPGIRGPLQTAAYAQAAKETLGVVADWRACVQLTPAGTYKVHHYDEERDLDAFLSALHLFTWKGSR